MSSPIAGTTRDAGDEVVRGSGHAFRFVDTRGFAGRAREVMAEKSCRDPGAEASGGGGCFADDLDRKKAWLRRTQHRRSIAMRGGRSVYYVVNKWDLMTRTGPKTG